MQISHANTSPADSLDCLTLEEILNIKVDVASTEEKTVHSTPSTVTIINKSDLETFGYATLAEALETVAGISIYRSYFKRDITTSRGILQDNYANKVLILINKIPAWHAVTGEGNLSRIAISDIERIEILKGPASVMYGSNAYTGVINIVLRESKQPFVQIDSRAGSHEQRSIGAQYSATQGDLSFFASAHSERSDGTPYEFTDETNHTQTVNEYVNSQNMTTHITYKKHQLMMNTFRSEESFLGVIPSFESAAGKMHDARGSLISYGYNNQLNKTNFRFKAVIDWQERSMPRNEEGTVVADIDGYKSIVGLGLRRKITDWLTLDCEFDYYFRHAIRYRNYNNQTQSVEHETLQDLTFDGNNNMEHAHMTENSFMGMFEINKGRFSAIGGSRISFNEDFGNNVSSNLTLMYQVAKNHSFKMMYGESYRSPSLFELHFRYPAVLGNADLKPETSASHEFAYVGTFKKLFIQLLGYYAEYENVIYREKQTDYTYQNTLIPEINVYQNGNSFYASGAEVELSYRNSKVCNVFANANYIMAVKTDSAQTNQKQNFEYVPQYSSTMGISKVFRNIHMASVFHYYAPSEGPFESIDAQYTVDFSAGIKHTIWDHEFKHGLYVKNITDQQRVNPEYVRRKTVNEVPTGFGRTIGYTLKIIL